MTQETAELATQLDQLNASDVCNALAQLGVPRIEDRVLPSLPSIVRPTSAVVGRARTMRVGVVHDRARRSGQVDPDRHLGGYDTIEPGELLVIAVTGQAQGAVVGGLVAMKAALRGAAGVITNGFVRDTEELESFGMPVWARGTTPVPMGHAGLSVLDRDGDVHLDGTEVQAGDLLVADVDGIVVVKEAEIAEVVDRCEGIRAREQELVEQIRGGARLGDVIGPA